MCVLGSQWIFIIFSFEIIWLTKWSSIFRQYVEHSVVITPTPHNLHLPADLCVALASDGTFAAVSLNLNAPTVDWLCLLITHCDRWREPMLSVMLAREIGHNAVFHSWYVEIHSEGKQNRAVVLPHTPKKYISSHMCYCKYSLMRHLEAVIKAKICFSYHFHT